MSALPQTKAPISEVYNMDNIEGMKHYPDNYFDLAIVDPPYGLPDRKCKNMGKLENRIIQGMYQKGWDIAPSQEYFIELMRVSSNQIIWGGNYFDLPPARCVIVWDKCQPWENFSQVEIAWTNFDNVASLFKYDNRTGGKIHPTEKPIKLYKWLLNKYAKEGQKILDTHLGSGSSRIAAHDMGFDFVAFELDKDYYEAQEKRFNQHISQLTMF